MKQTMCVFFLTTALLASGCAYYKIQPVAAASLEDWDKTSQPPEGYIFYQPELYFSVTFLADGTTPAGGAPAKPAVMVTPLYLPNYQKPFRVTTRNFLAKADFTFNFENGWKLTQISDRGDNSTMASTLAEQLQTILTAAMGTGPFRVQAGNVASASQLRVILFRPIYDEHGYIKSFQEVGAPEAR
ncbi:MAG: hypothetical protein WAO02_17265 [Verrucomicrobiia bacterium]